MIKFIYKIYNKCVIIIRRAAFMLVYFMFSHRRISAQLRAYGLSDVRAYQCRKWKVGLKKYRGKRHIRLFYRAVYEGKPCFIKLGKNDMPSMKRETLINNYVSWCGLRFAPAMLLSDDDYDDDTAILVTEYVSGLENFSLPGDTASFEAVCAELEHIHGCLQKFGIIHGDLNASNIMLDKDNRVIIIDFGIGWVPGADDYIPRGTYYTESGGERTYDNAFAFIKMLEECGVTANLKGNECYKRLERLVGVHTHTAAIPEGEI
jgi:serine/threonine protein kinase